MNSLLICCLLAMSIPQFLCQDATIPVNGSFYWSLLFRLDNMNNSGVLKHFYDVKTAQTFSYSQMMDTLQEYKYSEANRRTGKINVGGSYKVITASVEATTERSTEINRFLSVRVQTSIKSEFKEERQETREYNVGPNSKLELYQLNFRAPGVFYTFPTLSTVYAPPEQVTLNLRVQPIRFLSNIRVVYADSEGGRPTDRIREISGKNDDVNFPYGGKYVYLVPEYTQNVDSAMTGIDVIITDSNLRQYSDVSKGAGGDNRYIVPVRDSYVRQKITDVVLLRNENSRGYLMSGYSGITKDINDGRGKHYLHLMWKTEQV